MSPTSLARPQVPGDPRRPNDVVNYKFKSAKDDDLPDIYLMAALFLGMGAILLKVGAALRGPVIEGPGLRRGQCLGAFLGGAALGVCPGVGLERVDGTFAMPTGVRMGFSSRAHTPSMPCTQQKLVAWGAVLCVLCALSNYGPKADVKQMLRCAGFLVTVRARAGMQVQWGTMLPRAC